MAKISPEQRKLVFDHYGNKCACCGSQEIWSLTVDHVNNDGNVHRETTGRHIHSWIINNKYPDTVQLLCPNCNYGKLINKGIYPHKLLASISNDVGLK